MKVLAYALVSLLIAAAATAGVVVSADDGAALRIDAAKLAAMTDAAIRKAAPRAGAFSVTIAIEAPRVWVAARGIIDSRPLPATAVPPSSAGWRTERDAQVTSESVMVTYTITDPSGQALESDRFVLGLMHGGTLQSRLTAMRRTADALAARVRALSGN